jgi:hypothetical protein
MSFTSRIIDIILKDAENIRITAGFYGSFDDGGASVLESQVKFYEYGARGIIPPEWKKYENKLDPEYSKYLELKKKFEG